MHTRNNRLGHRVVGIAGIVAVLLSMTAGATLRGETKTAEVPWEYSPYQIRVWLGARPSAKVSPQLQEKILHALNELAPLYGGASWRLKAELAPETIRASVVAALDELTFDQASAASADAVKADKLILLSLDEQQGRFVFACRELDCRTRYFGQTLRQDVWQTVLAPRVAADVVARVFQPFVRVESSRGKKATVRVRAGGLVADEQSPSAIRTGDVLQPVIRRNDRRGEPKPDGIEVLDLTYLLVRAPQEYLLDCDVYSASRNPLVGRSSSTVERVAFRVRPQGTHTMLQLVDRDNPTAPLEGYEMWSKKPLADGDAQANPSVRLGLTDWRGMIDIEQSDLPLRLIYVKNGAHLLARVPVIPGYHPQATIPLGSDDKRLEAEAFVKGMESTVMDLVARREILAARIRRRIAEKKLDDARALLEEMKTYQTREQLEQMLATREAALATQDKRQQANIDKLLTGTRSLLNKHLSPELLVTLEREVSGLQSPPKARPKKKASDESAAPSETEKSGKP